MKRMAVMSACILQIVTFSASAQLAGSLQTAETSFDYTLTTLRESVDKFTRENRNLAATNDELRSRLPKLSDELASLQRDEARALDQIEAVDTRYQKTKESLRSFDAQLARLQQESASIDEEIRAVSSGMSASEKADQETGLAIEALKQDIRSLQAGAYPSLRGEDNILSQQRDQLQYQSNEVLASLQQAQQEWLEIQSDIDAGPERVEALRIVRNESAALLQDKKSSTAGILQQATKEENILAGLTGPNKANGAGMALTEKELRSLNTRSQELGHELEKLQQADMERIRKSREAVENEKGQLEARLVEESERNKMLRFELDKLRLKMVELDKIKVNLERALYGL